MNKWNKKRQIIRRYDLTADMYEKRYGKEQALKYEAALKNLNINRSTRILDVGCGIGLLFSQVAAKAQTVVGVDVSSKLLLQAKGYARKFPNVNLVQADADYLPFISNFFNLAFAFTVLQNVPNPLETLYEIERNVTCGAFVVVTGLKKVFSLKTFRLLLLDAGLQMVSIEDADPLKCFVAVTIQNAASISAVSI